MIWRNVGYAIKNILGRKNNPNLVEVEHEENLVEHEAQLGVWWSKLVEHETQNGKQEHNLVEHANW